jgi:hypothetical protein
MANYAVFDEQYYLASYPWVKPAIDAGVIQSGREHFEKYGQAAGLTKVSRYFDENTYLTVNSDIRPFVRTVNPNGSFASGLDHFIQFGYEEGQRRSAVSPEYSEDFYLANNSDLRPFIGPNAPFKSGYQHFIQFGSKESRFGTSFFEPEYLRENPDIAPFVNSGALRTGREHYFNFGKNEPSRNATFVGTRSNDILTGVGVGNTELIGVEVGINPSSRNRQYESFGTNEFDVLIGSPGSDTFVLGVPATAGNVTPTPLYLSNGQATIRNFDIENDFIQLQGTSLSNYNLAPVGNNLSIQTRAGDVLGVIEGGANFGLIFQESNGNATFLIG